MVEARPHEGDRCDRQKRGPAVHMPAERRITLYIGNSRSRASKRRYAVGMPIHSRMCAPQSEVARTRAAPARSSAWATLSTDRRISPAASWTWIAGGRMICTAAGTGERLRERGWRRSDQPARLRNRCLESVPRGFVKQDDAHQELDRVAKDVATLATTVAQRRFERVPAPPGTRQRVCRSRR